MTNLLSLPTELIIHILSCSTVQTATRLTSANKELHAIWLKHTQPILEGIARYIPAYQDVVDLTNLQYSFNEQPEVEPTLATQPPAVLHFRRLLYNADFAAEATAGWPDTWQHKHSYYLIRKLVLAHLHQDEKLKRALFSTLSVAPLGTPYVAWKTCEWLCRHGRDDHLGLTHCISKVDAEKVPFYYPLELSGCRPEWMYANKVATAVMSDRSFDGHTLEDAMLKCTYS
jgi:hypothetical protein